MARFLVLELGDTEGKLLVVSTGKNKGLAIDETLIVDWDGLERDDAGAAARGVRLRDAMKQRKIAPGPCGIIVPKQNAIVRVATLPSADPAEINQMAQFKAEEFIPFNAERHVISHGILRQDDVHGSEVLIAAVDGPVMNRALDVCREAKLEPALAEVTSIALVRCLSIYESEQIQRESLLLLNIGTSNADISIIHHGVVVATRSQPTGIARLNQELEKSATEEEGLDFHESIIKRWIDRMVRFTRQTYEVAAREHDVANTTHLFVCGEGSTLPGLAEGLREALGVHVHPFNPGKDIPRGKGNVDDAVLPAMAAALGTAHRMVEEHEHPRHRAGRVNLLPGSVLQQQAASERKLLLMLSATMVLITLVLLYLAFDRQNSYNETLTARYKAYNREMRSLVGDLEDKQERIEIIERKKSDFVSPLTILDQISRFDAIGSTQNNGRLVLTEFSYTTSDEVKLAGMASELEDIGAFTDYLSRLRVEDEPVFASIGVPTNSPNELSHRRGTVWTFSLTAILESQSGRNEEGNK